MRSAEGAIEYSAPDIADRDAPFRSCLRETVRGRTEELEALAVEMYARGLSRRDVEAVFPDADRRSLLSEYEAFASRDLSEFEITYLFVDGIAERLHLGQSRDYQRHGGEWELTGSTWPGGGQVNQSTALLNASRR